MSASSRICQTLLLTALLLGLVATAPSSLRPVQAAEEVQLPAVTGPIPMTETSRAFWDRMGPPREAALKTGYIKLWSRGAAPPRADRFQFDAKNQNVLDEYGNATGGLRSPYLNVPIATYSMGKAGGSFTCSLLGYKTPFNKELLKKLHRDHNAYVSKVKQTTEKLVKERFLLSKDAAKIIAEAKKADVP